MLIPVSGAKLAYWSRLLCGNKAKGEAFLSNLLRIDSWALEAIDDGAMVIVIYDPQMPNGTKLVEILEQAGYGGRALTVLVMLQLNLEQGADWNTIVSDAELMGVIWNNPSVRNVFLNSADAMTAVANSTTALTQLMANNVAWTDAINNENTLKMLVLSSTAINLIMSNSVAANKLFHSSVAVNTWFSSSLRDNIMSNTSIMNTMISSRTIMNTVGQSRNAMSAIYDDAAWRAAVLASSVAMDGLNDVAIVIGMQTGYSLTYDDPNELYSFSRQISSGIGNNRVLLLSVDIRWSGAGVEKISLSGSWQSGSPINQTANTPGTSGTVSIKPVGFGANTGWIVEYRGEGSAATNSARYILC